jgi:hypothetical protein
MAYDPTDLRSRLAPTATASRVAGANVAPQYFEFDTFPPTETSDAGTTSWWVRSQACVVNYLDAAAGERLERTGQPDEYVILADDASASLTLEADGESVQATGRVLVVMPPGDSAVTAAGGTRLVRLFTTQSDDLCQRCDNDGFYVTPDPNVAPYQPWPDPPDGHRIRCYQLDDFPADDGRFGRLFRCSTFMINYFYLVGPRDPAKLSPHHHDDFEQLSLQLGGDYVHHLRTPWVPDMNQWKEDEHQFCTSPSVTVIPPPSVHTSQAVGEVPHQLVDIFCPPRSDFSAQPGWVLNAEEYPEPSSAASNGG